MSEHTFVICAYRESPYLEECIQSLRGQTVASEILMVTSTPMSLFGRWRNTMTFRSMSTRGPGEYPGLEFRLFPSYHALSHHRPPGRRLSGALHPADAGCHEAGGQAPDLLYRLRRAAEGKPVLDNGLLKVKRLMLTPLKVKGFSGQPLGPAQGALHGLPHLLPPR